MRWCTRKCQSRWAVFLRRPSSSLRNRRPHCVHGLPSASYTSGIRCGRNLRPWLACRLRRPPFQISMSHSRIRSFFLFSMTAMGTYCLREEAFRAISAPASSKNVPPPPFIDVATIPGGGNTPWDGMGTGNDPPAGAAGSMPAFLNMPSRARGSDGGGGGAPLAGSARCAGGGDLMAATDAGGGAGSCALESCGVADLCAPASSVASAPCPNSESMESGAGGADADGGGATAVGRGIVAWCWSWCWDTRGGVGVCVRVRA